MIDWWTEVRLLLAELLARHGLLSAFAFLLVEEAGLPIPVPGDFVMLLLGVQARQGLVPLWQALFAMQAATMLGATFLYVLSTRAGRGLVYRYGRFIRLSPERLERSEAWIRRHGFLAVFLGRLVPGLRIVTAVGCGVFGVPLRVFLPAMSLGALAYILVYTLLGYLFGPPVLELLEHLHLPLGVLGSLVLLAILLVWTVRAHRSLRTRPTLPPAEVDWDDRLRAGAVAGGLATMVSTLLLNVLVHLAGQLRFRSPGLVVEQTASFLSDLVSHDVGLLVFVAAPAFVGVGVAWGVAYAAWIGRRPGCPDWRSGPLFALLPLMISALVVMPLLGLGLPGLSMAPASGGLLGETVRHLAFGLVLGLTYPVLLPRPRKRKTRRSSVTPESDSSRLREPGRASASGTSVIRELP